MALDVTVMMQYGVMWATAIFFTVLAIERKTILTNLLCGIIWIFDGMINFLVAPTGTFTFGISMLFWVIGCVFMVLVVKIVFDMHGEATKKRFDMEPM